MRVADPDVPRCQRVFVSPSPALCGGGCSGGGLVPIRGLPHRVTRASNHFAGGDAHCVVKPSSVLYRGGGEKRSLWASSSAGSARTMFASGAHCIVKPPSVLYRGGGEKRLQLRVFVTRAWCGPGVTFRSECEGMSGWGSRAAAPDEEPRSVPPAPDDVDWCCHPGPPLSRGGSNGARCFGFFRFPFSGWCFG